MIVGSILVLLFSLADRSTQGSPISSVMVGQTATQRLSSNNQCSNVFFPETQCVFACKVIQAEASCVKPCNFVFDSNNCCFYTDSGNAMGCSEYVPTPPSPAAATPLLPGTTVTKVFDPQFAVYAIEIPPSTVAGSLLHFQTLCSVSSPSHSFFAQLGSPGTASNAQFIQTLGHSLYIPVLDGPYRNATLFLTVHCNTAPNCMFTYEIFFQIVGQ